MSTVMSNQSLKFIGRTTGFLYLVIIVCGMFTELFVRSSLIVPDDAAATVSNIISNILLFRMGFVSDLIMVIADVMVAVSFYVLLRPVNSALALLAALFRLTQSSILGANLLNHFNAIILLEDKNYLQLLGDSALSAQVMFYVSAQRYGYLIALVFFALSCIILGYLMYHSPLFPKVFGYLLPMAGIGYLIDSFTNFLYPQYAAMTEYLVVISALVAEVSLCIYLIAKGVKAKD